MKYNIKLKFHNDNNKISENIIKEIEKAILNKCKEKDVYSYFNNYPYVFNSTINIYIMSKENLDNYIQSIENSFINGIPKWVTGITTNNGVYLVPDTNNIYETITLVLHETIHYLSKQIKIHTNSKRYNILEEALSTYISSQMTTGKFSKIVEDYKNNKLRTISFFLENDDNEVYAKNNGYYYSFFFMKFLKNK